MNFTPEHIIYRWIYIYNCRMNGCHCYLTQAGIHSIVLFILLKSSIWKYHFRCDFNYIKLNENLFHNITYAVPAKASQHVIIRKHEWRWAKFLLKTLYGTEAMKLDLLYISLLLLPLLLSNVSLLYKLLDEICNEIIYRKFPELKIGIEKRKKKKSKQFAKYSAVRKIFPCILLPSCIYCIKIPNNMSFYICFWFHCWLLKNEAVSCENIVKSNTT